MLCVIGGKGEDAILIYQSVLPVELKNKPAVFETVISILPQCKTLILFYVLPLI